MKYTLHSLVLGLAIAGAGMTQAQRYLEPIFDSNQYETDVQIGFNVDALRSDFTDFDAVGADMAAINGFIDNDEDVPLNYFVSNGDLPDEQQTTVKLFPMSLDIYSPPADDTEDSRPLIIYLHTGNFLPPIINGAPTGSLQDSALVNQCKLWARSGYVVAALDYRLGWNPVSEIADVRRGTLLKAVYRALHDTQTAVRFMRSTVASGNPYGIDPSKIVLFGQGSGGYVAQAYATLDDYNSEIAIPKFIGEDGAPYVVEAIDGDIDGGPGAIRLADPLQEAGISKDISMSINIGGALADISWLEDGDVPMVSVHCLRDPFAPFDDGTVVVPTTGEDVVDVSGANVFIQQANDFGNNDVFAGIPDGNDPYTDAARSHYGQTYDYILGSQPTMTVSSTPEGLFPLLLPINTLGGNIFTNEGSPWDWWDFTTLEAVVAGTNAALGLTGEDAYDANVIHAQNAAGNPGMGPDKGMTYIDSIQGYVNPRIMCALELPGAVCTVGIEEQELLDNTEIFPNPATATLSIRNNENAIVRVELVDVTGRRVKSELVNGHFYELQRGNLKDGVYLLQVIFEDQQITKKVLFN